MRRFVYEDMPRLLRVITITSLICICRNICTALQVSTGKSVYLHTVTFKQQPVSTEMFIRALKQHFRQTWQQSHRHLERQEQNHCTQRSTLEEKHSSLTFMLELHFSDSEKQTCALKVRCNKPRTLNNKKKVHKPYHQIVAQYLHLSTSVCSFTPYIGNTLTLTCGLIWDSRKY